MKLYKNPSNHQNTVDTQVKAKQSSSTLGVKHVLGLDIPLSFV